MKKGFTLVELLGVMVIMSVIIAVAFPIVINIIKEKKEKTENYEIQMIENAAKLYFKENTNDSCVNISTLQRGKYLESVKTTKRSVVKNGNNYEIMDNNCS